MRKAFTLIELLVVIAIIAILAAILFPVFAQARDKARQIACLSNAKQVGTAVMMYVQDYDEMYPSNHWGIYYVTVQPYMKNGQVWRCPSYSGVYTVRPCFWWGQQGGACTGVEVTRVVTGWLSNSDVMGGWDNSPPKPLANVGEPASTVELAENDNYGGREGAINEPPGSLPQTAQMAVSPCRRAQHATFHPRWNVSRAGVWPTGANNLNSRLGAHHFGGLQIVYADGHAKFNKVPPADCHAWVPGMPAGARLISDKSTVACNRLNQIGNYRNSAWVDCLGL